MVKEHGAPFITLGIETSCDETACAVLRNNNEVLSNVIASSLALHQQFGGVVPEIASRHSLEYIEIVFRQALEEARVTKEAIDLIGVTQGPGLVGSLLVGISFAKGLSYALSVPFIGVNHLEGHLYANFLNGMVPDEPFLGLLVSGGHTAIVYCNNDTMTLVGETIDDAVGEAYDKVAKMMKIGYPGGPVIERYARSGDPKKIQFGCARLPGTYDFSFSGVKTAVLYYVRDTKNLEKDIPHICASFQRTVVSVIVEKTIAAAKEKRVSLIVVGGGVSANQYLRDTLTAEAAPRDIRVSFPGKRESLDNGAMIARRAYELYHKGKRSPYSLSAEASWGIK